MSFLALLKEVQNTIAPPRCLNCLEENTWFCRDCQEDARFGDLSCIVCKTKQPRGLTCRDCRSTPSSRSRGRQQTPIEGLLTVDTYHAPALRRGVHWLKFKHVRPVAPVLASLLAPRLTTIAPIADLKEQAVIVPIPLHPRRLRERGFNQSEDIASAISRQTGIPYRMLLTRRRATHAQAKLPENLRQKNLQQAFIPLLSKEGLGEVKKVKYIILLDDVATSGATLNAAATALIHLYKEKLEGVHIWAAAVARG